MPSNRIVGAVGAALLAVVVSAPTVTASPRGGELHVTKECSEYTGGAGSFCTFTSSNVRAIQPGDRIVYAQPAGVAALDTAVVIVGRPGSLAVGHCTLVWASLPGRCTFSGGSGQFVHFRATASVSVDGAGLWHWDGIYVYSPKGA